MRAEQFIDALAAGGRHHFTTHAAIEAIGGSAEAVRAQLRRLKQKGRVASPMRSFHVVVPPEYRRLGCLPAEHFVGPLMEYLGQPYYVALLSAAERHGAAHQRPQSLQVMTTKARPPVECGHGRILFVARSDLERMPTLSFRTPRGYVRYSTPEVTALEMVGYPRHSGGLGNVVTVLAELRTELDRVKLVEAAMLSPIGWSQRLGHLLERLGAADQSEALLPVVNDRARSYIPLRRSAAIAGATRDPKWKVLVNVELDPDA